MDPVAAPSGVHHFEEYDVHPIEGGGICFTGVDAVGRGHRLRVTHLDGEGVELVVVHGAKCGRRDEDGDLEPTEVLHLDPDQCDMLAGILISVAAAARASQVVAGLLRDGCQDADRVAAEVMGAATNLDADGFIEALAEARDASRRGGR